MSIITGSAQDDTLDGTSEADTLQGFEGADSLNGQAGTDLLFGGAGDDRLNGGDLTGSVGVSDDTLVGGAGDDVLFGRRGSDDYVFGAGFGQDEILDNSAASDERDRVVFDATVDRADIRLTTVFDQSQASDLIIISDVDGSSILLDDFIVGGMLENGLRKVVFADGTILTLDQGLLLTGGSGADDMASADLADTLDGGDGDDRLNGMGGADLLVGGAGDDTLSGGNRLGFVDASNDTLVGGAGNDRLIGRGGDDDFVFGAGFGQDEIQSNNAADADRDRIVFDASIDQTDISIRTANTSGNVSGDLILESLDDGSSVTIVGLIDNGRLTNGVRVIAFADGTTIDLDLGFPLDGTAENDTLVGLGGADILRGLAGDDRLNGVLGADQIFGGAGQDTLDGGVRVGQADSSDDTLAGGTGDDRLTGRGGNDTFVFNDGDGADTVTDFTSGDIVDLRGVTAIRQFDDITALAVQNGDDTVLEIGNGDRITLEGVTASTLVAADFLIEPDNANLIRGTEGDDLLSGDGFPNIIEGLGGNDTIDGASGDDQLFGGTGNDQLIGEDGADTLTGGDGDDVLDGGLDTDTLVGGGGRDTFIFVENDGADFIVDFQAGDQIDLTRVSSVGSFADVLAAATQAGPDVFLNLGGGDSFTIQGVDIGDLIAADFLLDPTNGNAVNTPTEGDDSLRGDANDNSVDGLGGNDTILGEAGGDTLRGQQINDLLDGLLGNDTILGNGSGDTLLGNVGDDQLFGGEGDDSLRGGDGNDLAFGGNGQDTLVGGAGADTLDGDANDDLLQGGLGDDVLFGGGADDQIQGGEGDDRLFGGDGADLLDGQAGADFLQGAAGDDTLTGGDGNDQQFGGSDNDRLDGAGGDDQLFGGNGDDTLIGGDGADTLEGAQGADSLAGDAGDDLFVFLANGGDDRVRGFQAGNQTEDRLDVSALGFTRFTDVLAVATDGAEGVVLALGSGTSALLEGVQAGDLSADDFILAPDTTIAIQRIDPAEDAFIVGNGDQIEVTGVYATANPVDETLAGIGVRVHFDSSVLRFDGLQNLFPQALQPFGQVAEADTGDFDNDTATDTFVALNWADLGGAFPGAGATPLDLFDILFTGLGGVADTSINFSASSVANGREFASTSVNVAADRWPLPDTVEVAENSAAGTVVADLAPATVDPVDPGNFSLLEDADGRFVLDGFALEIATSDALDFELASSHSVAIRITNNAGGSIDRQIIVNLTDVNEAPTVISIDTDDIDEDAKIGDQVGTLAALDPEGDVIDFTLVDNADGRFALDGDRLVVAGGGLDFETAQSHAITLRATDTGGLSLDQVLDINVNDIAETTLDLDGDGRVNALTDGLIALGDLFNAPLSQLTALAAPGSPGADGSVLSGALDAARVEGFDVDDNGTVDALTDGLMILSHLFGAPAGQVASFAATDATRIDPAEITAFLDSFIPADATV